MVHAGPPDLHRLEARPAMQRSKQEEEARFGGQNASTLCALEKILLFALSLLLVFVTLHPTSQSGSVRMIATSSGTSNRCSM